MAYACFHRTKTSLLICSVSFASLITLGLYTTRLYEQIENLHQRLSSLRRLAVRSQEAAAFIQSHREDFAAFETCGFERFLAPEALQDSLRHAVEFGAISSLDEKIKNHNVVVQEVSFSIPCLQDRDIFELLDQLINQGPGVFQIHALTINRVSSLSEEMLEKIATGKPQTLFDGKISAAWVHR